MMKNTKKLLLMTLVLTSLMLCAGIASAATGPTNSAPRPANTATNQHLEEVERVFITVTDSDRGTNMNVTFRTNASGAWADIGTNTNVANSTQMYAYTGFSSYSTKYWWSVNTSNRNTSRAWDNDTYSFTTCADPLHGVGGSTEDVDTTEPITILDTTTPSTTSTEYDNKIIYGAVAFIAAFLVLTYAPIPIPIPKQYHILVAALIAVIVAIVV